MRTTYLRFFALQISVVSILSLLLWITVGGFHAYSALLGGMICILPGYVFAVNLFKFKGAHAARKIALRFYWGEGLKLLLTFILFALVFLFIPIAALPFFAAYIVTQLLYWLAPIVLTK